MLLVNTRVRRLDLTVDGVTRRRYIHLSQADIECFRPAVDSTIRFGLGADKYSPRTLLALVMGQIPFQIIGQDVILDAQLIVTKYSVNGQNGFCDFALRLVPTSDSGVIRQMTRLSHNGNIVINQDEYFPGEGLRRVGMADGSLVVEIYDRHVKHRELTPLNPPVGIDWHV